jgi:hypothetical protein
MSPKTFKNKKESNDSKRPDSSRESGSAPFSSFTDLSKNEVNLKIDHNLIPTGDNDLPEMPPLRRVDMEKELFEEDDKCKVAEYINKFDKAVIKVFDADAQVTLFPMFIKTFINKNGYFKSLRDISKAICEMVDIELERMGMFPFFAGSVEHEHGYSCYLRIEPSDERFGKEVNLHDKNYEDMFISTYLDVKMLCINVHVKTSLMHLKQGITIGTGVKLEVDHDPQNVSIPIMPIPARSDGNLDDASRTGDALLILMALKLKVGM